MPAKRFIVLLLSLGLFAAVASVAVWRNGSGATRTEDRNHDGVPDVWTTNRGAGDSVVDIDTNFDGRPDVRLRYHDGNLVSREADSDFDDRVDIVEEFDPNTHEVFRSLFDID